MNTTLEWMSAAYHWDAPCFWNGGRSSAYVPIAQDLPCPDLTRCLGDPIPAYICHGQEKERVTGAVDVFETGCVFCLVASGFAPTVASSVSHVLKNHLRECVCVLCVCCVCVVCVCVYACMHVCMYVGMCVDTHILYDVYIWVCMIIICTSICICECNYIYIIIHVCMFVHTYVRLCVHAYIHK